MGPMRYANQNHACEMGKLAYGELLGIAGAGAEASGSDRGISHLKWDLTTCPIQRPLPI